MPALYESGGIMGHFHEMLLYFEQLLFVLPAMELMTLITQVYFLIDIHHEFLLGYVLIFHKKMFS